MKKDILVVGQTPPPFGGQAIMIQHLIDHEYQNVQIHHIRMAFSHGMNDMGKVQLYKIFHLFEILLKIYYYRIFRGVKILYYPPSGPTSAVFRDLLILFPTRWMFKKTIFHFHASGLSEHLKKHNRLFQYVFRRCFFDPDVAIRLSESCPNEGLAIRAKQHIIIPNGLPDEALNKVNHSTKDILNILFIGLLEETKGELDLCTAVKRLKEQGVECKVRIAGEFKNPTYKERFFHTIAANNLEKNIEYLGVIRGESKRSAFRNSDVFCFPSYFHSESFPLVLIEAMSYGLPIVTTKWRGIPDMIQEGYNGFLVEINNPDQIANKLKLLTNVDLRQNIGSNARQMFEERYDIKCHLSLVEDVFNKI